MRRKLIEHSNWFVDCKLQSDAQADHIRDQVLSDGGASPIRMHFSIGETSFVFDGVLSEGRTLSSVFFTPR